MEIKMKHNVVTQEIRIQNFLTEFEQLLKKHGVEISLKSLPNKNQILFTMLGRWKVEDKTWFEYTELNLDVPIDFNEHLTKKEG